MTLPARQSLTLIAPLSFVGREAMSKNTVPSFASVTVGDELPPLRMPPITRQTLAIYCGASGDHNPVHVDSDFAKASGLDDVIAHGMLVMSYGGRILTQWVPQAAIRSFQNRFMAMTHIGDVITARARVTAKRDVDGTHCVEVEVTTTNQHGEVKTAGSALIALP